MKCIGEKCSSFKTDYFYPLCLEKNCRIFEGSECKLLDKIKETRDDLVRMCDLFENLLEINDYSLDEIVDGIN